MGFLILETRVGKKEFMMTENTSAAQKAAMMEIETLILISSFAHLCVRAHKEQDHILKLGRVIF